MNLPVLIIRHLAHEGPGYLEEFFRQNGIPYRLVRIDSGDPVPADTRGMGGLVIMGGSMSVMDPLPWIAEEISLIKQAIDRDIPVLGHCLGGQMIARALDGEVVPNEVSEIGWHATQKAGHPGVEDWLDSLDDTMELFHWHSETFSMPNGVIPLLHSRWCKNQGFAKGKILALQCHIEMTSDMIKEWVEINRHQLVADAGIQSAGEILRDLEERVCRLNHVAGKIYARWCEGLA